MQIMKTLMFDWMNPYTRRKGVLLCNLMFCVTVSMVRLSCMNDFYCFLD